MESRRKLVAAAIAAALLVGLLALSGCGASTLTLATTTSVEQSGLLAEILPSFEKKYDVKVTVVAKDLAADAVELGEKGMADALLVNSKGACEEFVKSGGTATDEKVMFRSMIVVGPSTDPAGLRGVPCMGMCKRMAASGTEVVGCGGNTDVDAVIKEYWEKCGQKQGVVTEGQAWFVETGKDMVDTLQTASDKQCYAITDKLTWAQNKKDLNLEMLVDRCGMLYDQYGVLSVNPAKHTDKELNTEAADEFVKFMMSADTQKVIDSYCKSGVVLYYTRAPVTSPSSSPGTSPSTSPM